MSFQKYFAAQQQKFRTELTETDVDNAARRRIDAGYTEADVLAFEQQLRTHDGEKSLFFLKDGTDSAKSNGPSTLELIRIFDSELSTLPSNYAFIRTVDDGAGDIPVLKSK